MNSYTATFLVLFGGIFLAVSVVGVMDWLNERRQHRTGDVKPKA